ALASSEPLFLLELESFPELRHKTTEEDTAHYTVPLDESYRRQLRGLGKIVDEAASTTSKPDDPKVQERRLQLERITSQFKNGVGLDIELDTGLISYWEEADHTVHVTDFTWLDAVEDSTFSTQLPGQEWEDHTQDPTADDVSNLVMVGHSREWKPGDKALDLDGFLYNLKTGRLCRIPYEGVASLPGCFMPGRKSVCVVGGDKTKGFQLVLIDLKTGENREFGTNLPSPGLWFGPVVSHDGKTIAAVWKDFNNAGLSIDRLLQSRVCLVDVESGKGKPISEPLDTAFLSWLPDDKGLILVSREAVDMNKPSVSTICRMNLKGTITPIRKGGHPLLIPKRNRILFENQDDDLWYTCNLDGQDVQRVADGLSRHGFPTCSPDGERLLFMKYGGKGGPVPVMLKFGERQTSPVTNKPGFWGCPEWR
ncbi:MAG: hypothetical protein GX616_20745, partial [Planctomycetes bacterium]|nr:hypothetical protein [Planctomycetota bacterium]